jgi:hypothetical protein
MPQCPRTKAPIRAASACPTSSEATAYSQVHDTFPVRTSVTYRCRRTAWTACGESVLPV